MRRQHFSSRWWVAVLGTGALLVASCGGDGHDGEQRETSALNLKDGTIETFGSEDAVPDGWGICADPECSIFPPDFPCQVLGPGACVLNPDCRLKVSIELYLSGIGHGEDAYPEVQLVCAPRTNVLTCDEIRDPRTCNARPDCEWGDIVYDEDLPAGHDPGACPQDDYDCPMPPPIRMGHCHPKVPQPCQELDEPSCGQREDCAWTPRPCPLRPCAYGEDCENYYCEPFCQPRDIPHECPPPPEPPIAPPYCEHGESIAQYDAQGCIIGFECEQGCPELAPLPPEICEGQIVPEYDDAGCIIGYRCLPLDRCATLQQRYGEALEHARACSLYTRTLDPLPSGPGFAPRAFQCTLTVLSGLGCATCPTYVNPANRAAVDQLHQLQAEWSRQHCDIELICPTVMCAMPSAASCKPGSDPGQGLCVQDPPSP